MSAVPEIDPEKPEDMGAAGGASGGGDENTEDYKLPGGSSAPDPPVKPPSKLRSMWDSITEKRKDPYTYKKLSDKDDIPISELPKEKSGLPRPKETAETSLIEGDPTGRVMTAKDMATMEVEKDFPNMDRSKVEARHRPTGKGTGAIIEVKMRHEDRWYPLYTKKGGYRKNSQRQTSTGNQSGS